MCENMCALDLRTPKETIVGILDRMEEKTTYLEKANKQLKEDLRNLELENARIVRDMRNMEESLWTKDQLLDEIKAADPLKLRDFVVEFLEGALHGER